MAKLLQTLIPIAFLLLAASHMVRSQTIEFSLNFTTAKPFVLTLQGDASFPDIDLGNLLNCQEDLDLDCERSNYLRLTRARPNLVGRALYWRPIQFWNTSGWQREFETNITFIITQRGASFGEGIAFFIAPVGSTIPAGSTGHNLGIFGSNGTSPNVFAVSYVTREVPFVGYHFGTNRSESTYAGITEPLIATPVTLNIRYNGRRKYLGFRVIGMPDDFLFISYPYDLSSLLTQQVQIGISASTGEDYYAIHTIREWNFTSTMVPKDKDD